jgi:fumarate hydratase class I
MPEFVYQELLPIDHHDATPYRLLTTDGISTFTGGGHDFVQIEPAALTLLAREAMRDISHLLRPGHLAQLRKILDDPELRAEERLVGNEWIHWCTKRGAEYH